MYHQSSTTLKRQDKSELNYAEIKLIQGSVDRLAVEMEENACIFMESLKDV